VGFGIFNAGAMPGADIIVFEMSNNLLQDYNVRHKYPLVFPDDVDIPLGGNRGFVAFALQIHYDNRGDVPGTVHDTGVEVHYTLIPYAQEAQAMVVGDGRLGLTGASVSAGAMSH
jgi:hypothetical protein